MSGRFLGHIELDEILCWKWSLWLTTRSRYISLSLFHSSLPPEQWRFARGWVARWGKSHGHQVFPAFPAFCVCSVEMRTLGPGSPHDVSQGSLSLILSSFDPLYSTSADIANDFGTVGVCSWGLHLARLAILHMPVESKCALFPCTQET